MQSTKFFFAGILILSLTFLASTVIPETARAKPETITTGEYPEAVGARCTDVDYTSKPIANQGAEGATFVTSPNLDGATLVHVGLYVDEITEVDESTNSFKMQGRGFWI